MYPIIMIHFITFPTLTGRKGKGFYPNITHLAKESFAANRVNSRLRNFICRRRQKQTISVH